MRVCLINPPSAFLLDDKVFPPLGVLRVGACLERNGIEVVVVDGAGPLPRADHYGITATTAQFPEAVRIRERIDGRAILGGAHATMVAAAAKRGSVRGAKALAELLDLFDCVVAGDGEEAIHGALSTAGLVDADDPKSPLYVKDQDSLPHPARHLIDMGSYRYEIDGKPATSVVTQLGCPFGCAFCGGRYSPFYRRVRVRSVGHIMAEVRHLHEAYGYRGFMFLDDELNVAAQMMDLMEQLRLYQDSARVEFSNRGFVKASLFNRKQAEALYAAGFREVLMGFESGSDRILKNMQKGSVADNSRALRIARDAGLRVKALMSLGHPGESVESVEATRAWVESERPEDFDITIITPYPGTPYWDDATQARSVWTYKAKNGDALHMLDLDYARDPSFYKGVPGQYVSHVFTDNLSREQLVALRDDVETHLRNRLGVAWPAKTHFDHSMGVTA